MPVDRPLRVIVYPHSMELGGSQLNAIEIAGAVRDLGHHVTVFADDGVLVDQVHRLGLPYVPGVDARMRPGPTRARHLARLVRDLRADVVHGYEWPPALEAFAATAGSAAVPVATVMSMAIAPFLPSSMPLAVGTARLQAAARARRRGPVDVIEPPVDTHANRPGVGGAAFRDAWGIEPDASLVVVVSRLARELKLEGILTAVRAVGRLAATRPVRLAVVGGGPASAEVAEAAAKANADAGARVILLTGSLADPRGAYDAADVLLGMGGSALRALAFEKPLIVQGEQGFFALLTPETTGGFLESGWYGVGPGADGAAAQARLTGLLLPLLDDPARRRELGAHGRALVERRFSLEVAAAHQVDIYRRAVEDRVPAGVRLADGARAAAGLARYKVARRVARARGTASVDDFNARPT